MWQDVFERNYSGFAMQNSDTMEQMTKALTAGTGVDAAAFTGGRAMTPESLDYTLVNILHNQDEARLFQRIKKQAIKSVVRQWNERSEVGDDAGGWVPEGGAGSSTDQTIARKYALAKYLQTYRSVTLQAAMSDMVENAMAIEKEAGTLWLIRKVEKALFYGDSSLVSDEPDGLKKLIPASNVIDMRGAYANGSTFKNQLTEGLRLIRASFGKGDLLLSSTKIVRDISTMLSDMYRIPLPVPGGVTQQGVTVGGGSPGGVAASAFPMNFPTPFGNPEVLDDIFLSEGVTQADTSVTTNKPDQSTISAAARANDTSGVSKFIARDAGDYFYKVCGVNRYGEGVTCTAFQVTSVVADDKVTFRVTPGSTPPTAWVVYRSKVGAADGSDCREMFRVAYALDSGQAYQTITDYNLDLPGCSDSYLLTMNPLFNAIEWFQFLPMMKFDLYPATTAVYPFLMLLFGGLGLLKPVQHVRIKNICPSDGWY
jgi:hypothetical protein